MVCTRCGIVGADARPNWTERPESDRRAMAVLSQPAEALLDHFVGCGQQRFRDGEAERLGGLEVDDKLELGRLLDRQIRWFLWIPVWWNK